MGQKDSCKVSKQYPAIQIFKLLYKVHAVIYSQLNLLKLARQEWIIVSAKAFYKGGIPIQHPNL